MTDIEITRRCAEAIGFYKHKGCWGTVRKVSRSALGIEAEGYPGGISQVYDPLHDDEQAMVLVKHFGLSISALECRPNGKKAFTWRADKRHRDGRNIEYGTESLFGDLSLNRVICECIAYRPKRKGKA